MKYISTLIAAFALAGAAHAGGFSDYETMLSPHPTEPASSAQEARGGQVHRSEREPVTGDTLARGDVGSLGGQGTPWDSTEFRL